MLALMRGVMQPAARLHALHLPVRVCIVETCARLWEEFFAALRLDYEGEGRAARRGATRGMMSWYEAKMVETLN